MRDLTAVMQDLYRHEVTCRIESLWDRGFRIVLGDPFKGDVADLAVLVEDLPSAGERLWSLALDHFPALGRPSPPAATRGPSAPVVPLSRLVARAAPESVFPLAEATPSGVDVLSFTVLRGNEHFETIWYANTRGEVREEVAASREPWRQSERFRHAMEEPPDVFRRLYVEP